MIIASELLQGRSGHDAGRELLARLYEGYTGKPLPAILCTPRGKPYFEDGDYHFSISHTRRRVVVALSRCPVGVDAEELDRKIDLRLAEKILSPSEREQYDAAPDKRLALLRFWVLKEAQVKLTGLGLQGYPNGTSFSLEDPRVQEMDGCLVAVLTEELE